MQLTHLMGQIPDLGPQSNARAVCNQGLIILMTCSSQNTIQRKQTFFCLKIKFNYNERV